MTGRASFFVILLCGMGACREQTPLPVLGTVPQFQLTSQTGARFNSSALHGHVWVADFIYTNCPGPCPLMSKRMKRIADATSGAVRLLSFSVDPARDTPAVFAGYGRTYGADPARWFFLTGDANTLEMLDRDAFKLGDLDHSFNHSTRFVLVDQQSRIRGYYGMSMDHMLERIVGDARQLERRSS